MKIRPWSFVLERGPVLRKGKERFFVAELGALFFVQKNGERKSEKSRSEIPYRFITG